MKAERSVAEGLKLIIDALDQGWKLTILVIAMASKDNALVQKTASRAVARGALVLEANEKIIGAITRRDNPQAVIGVFEQRYAQLSSIKPEKDKVWLALDRVRDSGKSRHHHPHGRCRRRVGRHSGR